MPPAMPGLHGTRRSAGIPESPPTPLPPVPAPDVPPFDVPPFDVPPFGVPPLDDPPFAEPPPPECRVDEASSLPQANVPKTLKLIANAPDHRAAIVGPPDEPIR